MLIFLEELLQPYCYSNHNGLTWNLAYIVMYFCTLTKPQIFVLYSSTEVLYFCRSFPQNEYGIFKPMMLTINALSKIIRLGQLTHSVENCGKGYT